MKFIVQTGQKSLLAKVIKLMECSLSRFVVQRRYMGVEALPLLLAVAHLSPMPDAPRLPGPDSRPDPVVRSAAARRAPTPRVLTLAACAATLSRVRTSRAPNQRPPQFAPRCWHVSLEWCWHVSLEWRGHVLLEWCWHVFLDWPRRRLAASCGSRRRTSRTVALERLGHSAFDASTGANDCAVHSGDWLVANAGLILVLDERRDGHQFDVGLLLRFGLRTHTVYWLQCDMPVELVPSQQIISNCVTQEAAHCTRRTSRYRPSTNSTKRLMPATMNAMITPANRMRNTPSRSPDVNTRDGSSNALRISVRPTESTQSAVGYVQLHVAMSKKNRAYSTNVGQIGAFANVKLPCNLIDFSSSKMKRRTSSLNC